MSEPTEPIPDEMISAYLDGELSADERRRVEQAIVQDPRYGHLLQQLESLREALRELPSQRLGEGFSERVLQRIAELPIEEVHSAASPAAASSTEPSSEAAIVSRRRSTRPPSSGIWRRRLIWPALVVAAAVVVMLLTPDVGRKGQQVVGVPDHVEQPDAVRPSSFRDSRGSRPSQPTPEGRLGRQTRETAGVANDSARAARLLESTDTSPEQESRQSRMELERLIESSSAVTPADPEGPQFPRVGASIINDVDAYFTPSSPAVLQAEVTSEQLTNVIAQLRQDQIPIVSTLSTGGIGVTSALGQSRQASGATMGEAVAVPPASDSPSTVQTVVVQAPLADVQASLKRAKVQSEPLERRGLERWNLSFAQEEAAQLEGQIDQAELPPASAPTPAPDGRPRPSPPPQEAERKTEPEAELDAELKSVAPRQATAGRVVLLLKIVPPAEESSRLTP